MSGSERDWAQRISQSKSTASNKSTTTIDASASEPNTDAATELKGRGQLPQRRNRNVNITNLDNAPVVPSPYDDRMRDLIKAKPTLLSNRVHVSWYRRFSDILPEKEQTHFQPYREIQTRDEDIALQHQFGSHECMYDLSDRACKPPTSDCKEIRELATARYIRIKKREEDKKARASSGQTDTDQTTNVPGQDIDLTTEFGFSANKKKIVCPVVNFLMKLHLSRERNMVRRSVMDTSKWRLLKMPHIQDKIREMVLVMKRAAARNRIQRLFNLVLCVDRFIKCVAMIAGDTQMLLKDATTHRPVEPQAHNVHADPSREKEMAFFKMQNYQRVGQVQVPFDIQMILTKPWFCRSTKEVEAAVSFLEKMRCFTAYPRQFQLMLARVAWYIELPTQKVIIRQCQQAVNFYLLLNGSVRIDRLEGSPWEGCPSGHFKTLSELTTQDMFGEECITQPFSERWYTATSQERCCVLDFNMHDYNGMIQTANTSEEAPDHIRFLCKLRIMDNFPKIKLLKEQDTNVTYFFFRPGTLVSKSVRTSPYVFVVRSGSCSAMVEIVPKCDSRKTCAPGGSGKGSVLSVATPKLESRMSRVMVTPGDPSRVSRRSTITALRDEASKTSDGVAERLKGEDKYMIERAKSAIEHHKSDMKRQIQQFTDKYEKLSGSIPDEFLDRYNLSSKSSRSSMTSVDRSSENVHRMSKRSSQLRWSSDEERLPEVSESQENADEDSLQPRTIRLPNIPETSKGDKARKNKDRASQNSRKKVTRKTSKQEDATSERRQSKIVGTNIRVDAGAVLYGPARHSKTSMTSSSSDHNNNGMPWQLTTPSLSRTASKTLSRTPSKTSSRTASKDPSRNPSRDPSRNQSRDPSRNPSRDPSRNPSRDPSRAPSTQCSLLKLPSITPRASTTSRGSSNKRRKRAPEPPQLSRFSQWKQRALLTATDVAGVEWLDYNDGNYKEPTEDQSLVSHGATIIMIKKEFLLKYLRKHW